MLYPDPVHIHMNNCATVHRVSSCGLYHSWDTSVRFSMGYKDDGAPGPCCLGAHHPGKRAPSSIEDAFVQSCFGTCSIGEILSVLILFGSRCFRKVFHLQVFKDNDLVAIDKPARSFMVKVVALVSNLAVTSGNPLDRLCTPVTPRFLPRKGLLCCRQFLLGFAKIAWMLDKFAVGKCGKMS